MIERGLTLTPQLANSFKTEFVGIFPKGYVSMLVGEPASGKTWFMLSMCRGIADGTIGLGCPVPYKQGKSVILAGETGVGLLCNRYKELGFPSHAENITVFSAAMCTGDDTLSLDTDRGISNLTEILTELKPDVVFVDTLISFCSGDESDIKLMAEPVRKLTIVAQKSKTAIILCHHFRKRKQGASSSLSVSEVIGTSAFTRLSALVAGLTVDDGCRTVQCVKSWWSPFQRFDFMIKNAPTGVYIACSNWNIRKEGN